VIGSDAYDDPSRLFAELDYEAVLTVIVGQGGRNVAEAGALSVMMISGLVLT
jgi:2-keto-4-pentenoate hydratase/2-oxohepta-3-ene-1,7-dioic acid hydratase in catechol pathway